MDSQDLFQRFGTALGLGLIVGLQRERSGAILAGIRTFPLITLLGLLCALLDPWAIAAGLIAVAATLLAGAIQQPDEKNPGLTTEIAVLVMFAIGAALAEGPLAPFIAVGGVVAVLLHLKPQMHGFVAKLGDGDLKAIMQFVAVSLIILPILPNRVFGPYDVLNPYKLWLTVVLIVGISLIGYLVYRFFGERAGTLAGGILGGLISSTATTVSYARRAKSDANAGRLASVIIMIASTVVFARVLVLIGVTAPNFLPVAVLPLGAMFAVCAIVSAILWKRHGREKSQMPDQGNPTELKAALFFVGIYALVLLAIAFAKNRFGSAGLYVISILSGLTDMDAITLSVSQLVREGRVQANEGWRLILTAGLSNLVFKATMVAFLGSRALLWRIAIAFAIAGGAGLALILLWPDRG